MRVSIIGDSFAQYYDNTYLQIICDSCHFKVIHHQGFPGDSQYKIYKHFLKIIDDNPDIIICCHTQHSRLYHPTVRINPSIFHMDLGTDAVEFKNIFDAAKDYYKNLYNEDFSMFVHNMIISEMQRICQNKNIKMINLPAFEHTYLNKFYGLWICIAKYGLKEISEEEYPNRNRSIKDTRLNHFSDDSHKILANVLIPYICNYNDNFQLISLHPKLIR